ncbi:Cof-type HAD-IIB family hydrolase [Companilactobacillus nodensis]|uniref:HAD superfamily hydrolase n=1 Tax=Companilactobacillus nodensis DSM 19682 = JCM 14932 = NBRC 107160 TaxID=1423775 RepID=A0A0R1K9C9_9LACO|nr:Cof-type HAD-IIB family hydrolase [Companilactobacillus nodensis]KRK80294.1 HAD superfamily hydrolase [Companilactobacillus nodensis DSM 19682 = JCM 14932 = NBRC 107160]
MIKLIASDMDGTLLNEKMEVSERNIQAIKDAKANGIEFLIASGRGLSEANPFLKDRVHPGYITLNGAEVFDSNEKMVSSNPISTESKFKIVELFHKYDIYFEVVTDKGIFSDNKELRISSLAELLMSLNPGTSYEKAYADTLEKIKLTPMTFLDSYDKIFNDESYQIMKLLAFDSDNKRDVKLEPLKDEIHNLLKDVVVTSSSPNNIEVNSSDAQKGIALLKYAKTKGIKQSEIMAIGDNLNDASMIQEAGVGVAMANAIPEIKDMADEFTDNNANDGVAQIIEKVIAQNEMEGQVE